MADTTLYDIATRRYPDQWGRPPQHPDYGQPPASGAPPQGTAPPGGTPYTGPQQQGPPGSPWRGPVPPSGTNLAPPTNGAPPPASGSPDGTSGTTPPAGSNNQSWRDQMRQEAYGRRPGGAPHGFAGGDYGGDVKARTSVKNTFEAIARDYDHNPEGLRQMVQDPRFRQAFPNARIVEHPTGDQLDFGDTLSDFESGEAVGIVDVGLEFDGTNNTGKGWTWLPKNAAGAKPASGSGAPGTITTPPGSSSTMPVPGESDGSRDRLVDPRSGADPTLYDLSTLYQPEYF